MINNHYQLIKSIHHILILYPQNKIKLKLFYKKISRFSKYGFYPLTLSLTVSHWKLWNMKHIFVISCHSTHNPEYYTLCCVTSFQVVFFFSKEFTKKTYNTLNQIQSSRK